MLDHCVKEGWPSEIGVENVVGLSACRWNRGGGN